MSGFKPFRYKDEVSKSVEKRKESLGAKPNTKKPVSELPATYRSKSISNGKRTNSDSNEKEKLRRLNSNESSDSNEKEKLHRLNSNESSGLHSRLDSSLFSNLNDSAICSDDTFEDEQHLPTAPPSLKSVSNVKNQNNPPEANQNIQNYESTRPPSNVPTEPINCPSMTDEPMEQVDNPVSALSIPELFTVYDQLLPVLNDVTPNSFCIRSKRDQLSSMIGTITKVLKDSRVALENCQSSESTKQLKDEISRLEADNFEQLRKNRECMKKIADSEAEILHLKRNPQRLPSIDVHKSEKEALALELETSKRENHRLNNAIKASEREIGVLKESFKAKIDENENLRSELENTKLQLNNYPNTIQQLEEKNNEIKTLNETIQKLTEEIEKVKKQLADATANNAEPQTVQHFLQKLRELEDKYEDEKARSARRGKNFAMQKADFDRVHKERNELKEKLGELTKENENLKERILQLEKRVDETSQFEVIQEAMVEFDAEVLKKNAEVADLNAEISKLTEKKNLL
uniref:Uncharacterized protein n=1 Tax=Panagrolaimus sp. JU765 TaxID=591449 RepID=A0AC34QTG7_9BILA